MKPFGSTRLVQHSWVPIVGLLLSTLVSCHREPLAPPPSSRPIRADVTNGPPATLTLISGSGDIGSTDPANQFTLDAGATFQPAFIIPPNALYSIIPGTQYISHVPDGNGVPIGAVRFRASFVLPQGYQDASLSVDVHADNVATVYLNGTQFGQQPFAAIIENFVDPPSTFTASDPALFHAGTNTLDFDIYNFGGPGPSFDYKAVVSFTPPSCAPLPAGIVSWWPAEGNANDVVDGNNGTLQGGATFAGGQVGQAFLLDGLNAYIDAGNGANLHVSDGDFTVEAWVQFNALAGDMSIVDKMANGLNNVDGWRLLKQADNRFWFCFGSTGNRCFDPAFTVFSQTVAQAGTWYHVAAVKSAAGFAIYVNGVQEDTRSPVPNFLDTHSADLLIGSNVVYAHLNGEIDEVSIYNRALTAAEIQAIFAAGSNGKCRPSSDLTPPAFTNPQVSADGVAWNPNTAPLDVSTASARITVQDAQSGLSGVVSARYSSDGGVTWTDVAPTNLSLSGTVPGGPQPQTLTATGLNLVNSIQPNTNQIEFTASDLAGNVAHTSFTILVAIQAPQTITFAPLSGHTFGDAPFGVSAAATSGLPVSFSVAGNCTIAASTVTITGAGSCAVTASQAGDAHNLPATPVTQTFAIAQAAPLLTWSTPLSIAYGTALSAVQLNATATGVGGVSLSGTFTYTPAAGTVLAPGTQTLAVSFSPADAADYAGAGMSVQITVLYNTTVGHAFLPPIIRPPQPVSVFKLGSTIPVKFQLFLADGVTPVSTAVATIQVNQVSSGVPSSVNETVTSTVPNQGINFRYDPTSQQYIFNLGTKGWTSGSFLITANLDDGSKIMVVIAAR